LVAAQSLKGRMMRVETMNNDEAVKVNAEIAKLMAETMKIQAETAKLNKETFWYPVAVSSGLLGAAVTFTTLVLKFI
jgi:cell division protein FtsB